MNLYVLDTDHLTLLRRGHIYVVERLSAIPQDEVAITIISIEEQFRGWFTQVRKARDTRRFTRAYAGLFEVIEMAKSLRVLPFSSAAVDRYMVLRKALPRLGKHDLAIGSIALEFKATVVTRNRQDFEQIPNLSIEDWAIPMK